MPKPFTVKFFVSFVFLSAIAGCADVNGRLEQPKALEKICAKQGLVLQTLGTGGPIAEGARAGSSNLIWVDGKGRFLVDAGPGLFLRYGQAKSDFGDLDAILLTHAHGDHIGGLPGLLNSGSFAQRSRPLALFGPEGNANFVGPDAARDRLAGAAGLLPYLKGYLDGSEEKPRIDAAAIDAGKPGLQPVLRDQGIEIDAVAVHHGPVPALAYVITYRGKSIIFAGDQSFLSEDFVKIFAGRQPDILVMHNVISMAEGQPRGLHRDGKSIGEAAAAIKPKKLLLSHNMKRALDDQDAVTAAIRSSYTGVLELADDLDCFAI